jgi:adenosylcobinamide-phosphate synthase
MIIAAVILDMVFGDPSWLPHPVRLIGSAIAAGDRYLHSGNKRGDLINGGLLASGVVAIAGVVTWATIQLLQCLSPYAGALAAVVIAWTTLAVRGLDQAASLVEHHLSLGDEDSARRAIRALVGRDAETLDRSGLIAATIESIAENSSDGFVAPLLFLITAGPVGAVIYKAINTLDSMIGHRDSRYLYFGRFAARLDDLVNLIPSRLTALSIALAAIFVTARGWESGSTCIRDAGKHPSPNAGYPEAAMAGALGLQLGGDAFYAGELERRAFLGDPEVALDLTALHSARVLMWTASLLALILMLSLRVAMFGV